jgi:hypothetical protein
MAIAKSFPPAQRPPTGVAIVASTTMANVQGTRPTAASVSPVATLLALEAPPTANLTPTRPAPRSALLHYNECLWITVGLPTNRPNPLRITQRDGGAVALYAKPVAYNATRGRIRCV